MRAYHELKTHTSRLGSFLRDSTISLESTTQKYFFLVAKHGFVHVLGFVAQQGLDLKKIGVKTSFLHRGLKEDIYLEKLEGFIEIGIKDLVYKLKKSLYGLKQSLQTILVRDLIILFLILISLRVMQDAVMKTLVPDQWS